jgi:hypothetical protein
MQSLITSLPLILFLIGAGVVARFNQPRSPIGPQHRLIFLAGITLVAVSGTIATALSRHSTPAGIIGLACLWLALLSEGYRRFRERSN